MRKLFLAVAVAIVTATAVAAQENGEENVVVVSSVQTDKQDGYDGDSTIRCGIRFCFQLSGITKVELESVDGYPLAGKASIVKSAQGNLSVGESRPGGERASHLPVGPVGDHKGAGGGVRRPALLPQRQGAGADEGGQILPGGGGEPSGPRGSGGGAHAPV